MKIERINLEDSVPITRQEAGIILEDWLGIPVNCHSIKKMHGGMVDSVLALEFDKPPYRAVVKTSRTECFDYQANSLNYLRAHSQLPVPEVYLTGYFDEATDNSFMLIEMLPGINMGDANITPEQREKLDCQLAEILLELHSHTRDLYGDIDNQEFHTRWIEWLYPRIQDNWKSSKHKLTQRSVDIIPGLLKKMPEFFADQDKPTLVHGDIWTNNIIIDKCEDEWNITGFIDPGVCYADVEMELAYLEVFQTVTEKFFECYYRHHPMREGYQVRKLYYWLNTLLLHVWLFGDEKYINRTEKVAVELSEMLN